MENGGISKYFIVENSYSQSSVDARWGWRYTGVGLCACICL